MRRSQDDFQGFERLLLEQSVSALQAGRDRCVHCRRSPLIGERMHVYTDGRIVCELCRPLRREEPIRAERVHGSEFGHSIRLTVRAA